MKTLRRLAFGALALATASCATSAATTSTQSPTVNVTGDWVGSWVCGTAANGNGMVVMKLVQSGSQVAGDVHVTGITGVAINRTTDRFRGVVSGDTFTTQQWPDLAGSLTVAGDKMTGPFSGVACSGTVTMTREPWKGTASTSRLRSAAFTVESINLPTRMVALRGPKGESVTMQVDERVRNLPQVSVGDIVTVAYYESWALALDKPGDTSGAILTGKAAPGQMPAGFAAKSTTIQATVTAIDAAKPSATFRGPKGVQEVSMAEDPRILSRLKVGETYNVTYSEALIVAVEKTAQR